MPAISFLSSELSKHYGFKIPDLFCRFVQHAIEGSCKEGFFDYYTFLNYYHFFDFKMPVIPEYEDGEWCFLPDETYNDYYCYGVPPELCLFGRLDSLKFGIIVHDPSIENNEWPVGKVAEMDLGVIKYGDNTKEGIESFVALARMRYKRFGQENESYAKEAEMRFKEIKELFALNLNRTDVLPEFNETYDFGEKKVHAVPMIPDGWRFEQTVDGIGVLAPARFFSTEEIADWDDTEVIEDLINKRYYATALKFLRNELWQNWHHNEEFYTECAHLMQTVYRELNREKYAERVTVQLGYMSSLNF